MDSRRVETIEIDPERRRGRVTRYVDSDSDYTGAVLVITALAVWVVREWRVCRRAREQFHVSERRLAEAHDEFMHVAQEPRAILDAYRHDT